LEARARDKICLRDLSLNCDNISGALLGRKL
jgi:hypothetical protein